MTLKKSKILIRSLTCFISIEMMMCVSTSFYLSFLISWDCTFQKSIINQVLLCILFSKKLEPWCSFKEPLLWGTASQYFFSFISCFELLTLHQGYPYETILFRWNQVKRDTKYSLEEDNTFQRAMMISKICL